MDKELVATLIKKTTDTIADYIIKNIDVYGAFVDVTDEYLEAYDKDSADEFVDIVMGAVGEKLVEQYR